MSSGAGQMLEFASIDFQCPIEAIYEDVRCAEIALNPELSHAVL